MSLEARPAKKKVGELGLISLLPLPPPVRPLQRDQGSRWPLCLLVASLHAVLIPIFDANVAAFTDGGRSEADADTFSGSFPALAGLASSS
eukprot:scaffold3069_cov292-Pinguiococcus_pyrenoidosus.AAC.4